MTPGPSILPTKAEKAALPLTVMAGDEVTATVLETAKNRWLMDQSIDITTGQMQTNSQPGEVPPPGDLSAGGHSTSGPASSA